MKRACRSALTASPWRPCDAPGDAPVTGRRTSSRTTNLRQAKLGARDWGEGLQKQFGPKVNSPRVVEIVEVAQMDIPGAEANLHHPFAAPPIPRDTGKARPVSLWHGCTSMLH